MLLAPAPGQARRRQPDLQWAPSAAALPAATVGNGAIFQVDRGYAPLTSGQRAAGVGDVLTITLVERTQAVKSNSANYDRDGETTLLRPPATGPLALFKGSDATLGANATFGGKGDAAQSNALTGEITVTVAQVYPNGTMLVRGEKGLTLNRGDEAIRLSGIVRVADISVDNRVLSTRVADARITYTGRGEIARASGQGWLGRFFSRISPF